MFRVPAAAEGISSVDVVSVYPCTRHTDTADDINPALPIGIYQNSHIWGP